MTFGEFFKSKRILIEPSLRGFCEKFGFDPGNISRMERNLIPPPQNNRKLLELAEILRIKKSSPDFQRLFVLAEEGAEANRLLALFQHIADKNLIRKIPALLRSLDTPQLTEQKLDKLIEIASSD